jgi:hypothetical protein
LGGFGMDNIGVLNGRLEHFEDFLFIIWPVPILYCHQVYFVVIWYIFPVLGILYQEKSGNPDRNQLPLL